MPVKTVAANKDILTLEETITLFKLSRRKFHDLIHEGGNTFAVKYYNERTLIIKSEFARYLDAHPEIRRQER